MSTALDIIEVTQRNNMPQATNLNLRTRLLNVTTGFLLLAVTGAHAEDGTPAQRSACKPDVFRLCRDFIPDRTAITDCLESNKAKLSPTCRAVFSPKSK